MKTFPMFLKMSDRRVVIIGDGEQAAQKARLMCKTEAEIVLFSKDPDPELSGLVQEGRVKLHPSDNIRDLLAGAALCFVATGCKGADASWHAIAKAAGIVVNVVDYPELCDALTPSIVDRDPVVVAIGTEGTAPVLGRQIKTRIEEFLEPRLGELATISGRLRPSVAALVPQTKRRSFWRWVFNDEPRRAFAQGRERDAAAMIKRAISDGDAPGGDSAGGLSIITTTPGCADLMTLRAVKRLQEADVIYYHESQTATDVLELARRDATRICLSSDPLVASLPSAGPLQTILRETERGLNAVWLVDSSVCVAEAVNGINPANRTIEIVPPVALPKTGQENQTDTGQTPLQHLA